MAGTTRYQVDNQILIDDAAICRHIDSLDFLGRGAISQDILKNLRDFVEHIMLKIYAHPNDIEVTYPNICKAIEFVKKRGNLKLLRRFHDFLQIVASHYLLDEENSERLMLKYYEYLLKIKSLLKTQYSLDVLGNIEMFPIDIDPKLAEYHEKIAARINRHIKNRTRPQYNDRFYIHKIKPFFVDQKVYYEVTFTPAMGYTSKFDRHIAFTNLDISKYYAVKLFVVTDCITILDKVMPIHVIVNWETSIRPCEIENFSKIVGANLKNQGGSAEYRGLMKYLTQTGLNLVEVLDFADAYYNKVKTHILASARVSHLFDVLDACRDVFKSGGAGSNVLRYLLLHLNNKVIKDQLDSCNSNLSNLCLSNKCIPFDQMPFNSSLISHNPKLGDLFECLDATDRRHEILARFVRNNTELKGQLYTPITDIVGFDDVDELIRKYNRTLWRGHPGRRLEKHNNHVYIREYEEDTLFIIKELKEMAAGGIPNYSNSIIAWLQPVGEYHIDCEEKTAAITQMFEKSKVALIYGSAGTGKSTLINHISHFNADYSKLFLANTNPAVDNLKRRVTASNCTFSTIASYTRKQHVETNYDVVIVDECSTVSNRDMRAILEKTTHELLVLVGDIHQIEAIRFGNWFGVARSFIPETSVSELMKPYRSSNEHLLELWKRVRYMDDTVLELITKQGYSATLDESIFTRAEDDEIILCLNYDGLYGINNINHFLQQSNPNPPISWNGIQEYKVSDPILFNESERFSPLIYNNMKGRIVGVEVLKQQNQIQFDIELDRVLNGMDARFYDFELLEDSPNKKSVIRFLVDKTPSTDDDDDSASAVIPFQVAYAVSIHKAQGLEYESVKIVITDEVDELITHNIFYTAITRARDKLKIYWTPEVEKKVLSTIKPKMNSKDVALLSSKLSS
ncbi:ATP-dependent RecD-like DNA helicase [Ruminococcaceae bacterium OttesenSCG-928-O06]|nr:ATP-dependent RecD-like DNA helicase [Ruminococcaceae bacterium OttesenSCG-928-O06]